jgi:putative drug exporter of the RND superfamily
MLRRLALTTYRRRRRVVIAWCLLLVGLVALNASAGGEFLDEFSLPGSEAQEAFDLLESHGFGERAGSGDQIVFRAEHRIDDPQVVRTMERLFVSFDSDIPNTQVAGPYPRGGGRQISVRDLTLAYAEVNLGNRSSTEYEEAAETELALVDEVDVPQAQSQYQVASDAGMVAHICRPDGRRGERG